MHNYTQNVLGILQLKQIRLFYSKVLDFYSEETSYIISNIS
jgi:hypothetical protein